MGVYINIEMPKSCETCAFSRLSNTGESIYCVIDYDTVPWGDGLKSENCPLVPVPPHGDLIDRDGLACLSWIADEVEDSFDAGVLFVLDHVDELPTIIPAEEGET